MSHVCIGKITQLPLQYMSTFNEFELFKSLQMIIITIIIKEEINFIKKIYNKLIKKQYRHDIKDKSESNLPIKK